VIIVKVLGVFIYSYRII